MHAPPEFLAAYPVITSRFARATTGQRIWIQVLSEKTRIVHERKSSQVAILSVVVALALFLTGRVGEAREFAGGKIELFFGPQEYGAENSLEEELIGFINQAKESLDISVQELDSEAIAQAILNASRREKASNPEQKLNIRIILEESYQLDEMYEENRQIYMELLRAGIRARLDYNSNIMHDKFIIRDYNREDEAVWLGSVNFTTTGTHANYNNAVVIRNHEIAKAYMDEFREQWSGQFGKRFDETPAAQPVDIGGISVQPLFAPDNNPENAIVDLINDASRSIRFMIFTFSQSSQIDDAILAKLGQDISVCGIFDKIQAKQQWTPDNNLLQNGAKIRWDSMPGKLHHKLLILDDETVVLGSLNFTKPANEENDENIVIIKDPGIASYVTEEFKRIWAQSDTSE